MNEDGKKQLAEVSDPALAATAPPSEETPDASGATVTAAPANATPDAFDATVTAAPANATPDAFDATVTETASPQARAKRSATSPRRRLAHYQLEEEIGRGGMGVVYRARDLALERPVAIKVLSDEFSGATEQRFYREARAQARINHPNVCHIYFVGEDKGQLFFAMEHVDGQSLSEMLEDRGRLPAPEALDIVRQAVLGLREAQRHGIVHRDVKPSNLMIDRHGVVKVMDFGIAKQAAELPETAVTDSGSVQQTAVAGTPLYAAPEQLSGDAIDHRADIYALGVTLHKLLTGSVPFKGESVEEITQLHKSEERPQFERRVIGQRDLVLLNQLTDRMMAKSPADRFASYDDLLEGIEFAEPSASRPARFGIRALSIFIDFIAVLLMSALVDLVVPNDDPVIILSLGPIYMVVLLGRFGTTLGRWLLGIEVTNPKPGRGIGFKAAAVRTAWQLGPTVFFAALIRIENIINNQPLEIVGIVGLLTALGLNVVHVAYTSFRSGSARTLWDQRAGTQVRYLRVRSGGGDSTAARD